MAAPRVLLPPPGLGRDMALEPQPEALPGLAARLLAQGWFLEDIRGLDLAEGLGLDYHFAHWTRPGRLVARLVLPRDNPACPSIEGVCPGAAWHERETRDFFGVDFAGQADDSPLLLDQRLDPPPLVKAAERRVPAARLRPGDQAVSPSLARELLRDLFGDDPPGGSP